MTSSIFLTVQTTEKDHVFLCDGFKMTLDSIYIYFSNGDIRIQRKEVLITDIVVYPHRTILSTDVLDVDQTSIFSDERA